MHPYQTQDTADVTGLAETKRLLTNWQFARRLAVCQPTKENEELAATAHAAYEAEQSRAVAALLTRKSR